MHGLDRAGGDLQVANGQRRRRLLGSRGASRRGWQPPWFAKVVAGALADLDPALVAIGQIAGKRGRQMANAAEAQRSFRDRERSPLGGPRRRQADGKTDGTTAAAEVGPDQDVLGHRDVREKSDQLK